MEDEGVGAAVDLLTGLTIVDVTDGIILKSVNYVAKTGAL